MRRLVWSDEARENLIAIRSYIDGFNPLASQRLAARLVTAAESLIEFPDRGQPVRRGVRDLLAVSPYLIRYAVTEEEIRIIKIRHTAQRPERRT
jgi:plasmid stabilization system protein ParE